MGVKGLHVLWSPRTPGAYAYEEYCLVSRPACRGRTPTPIAELRGPRFIALAAGMQFATPKLGRAKQPVSIHGSVRRHQSGIGGTNNKSSGYENSAGVSVQPGAIHCCALHQRRQHAGTARIGAFAQEETRIKARDALSGVARKFNQGDPPNEYTKR